MTTPSAPSRGPDDLEPLFALVRSVNPFIDNRVNGLTADGVDVDAIHRTAFERLTALAREARDLRRGFGAVLWGEAGIGKSHLLSRLMRWADKEGQAIAVYLHNLQANPDNLPRSVLKAVVSILMRGQVHGFGRTPLYEMIRAFIREAMRRDPTVRPTWSAFEREYHQLIDGQSAADPSRAALMDRTVYGVLFRFFQAAHPHPRTHNERVAALAIRWLSGEFLDPTEAGALGLPASRAPDEPVALADNQQIKQVLVALCRLALSKNQPFLLCFDQVDNLDDEQAAALARFLEALLDSAPNLLVVTAGIKSSLLRWHETRLIQDSAWDRLAQFETSLQKLSLPECQHLVAARLEQTLHPVVNLEPVRQTRQHDSLFPLGRAWADDFFRDKIELRPRDVISGAYLGWQREQEALRKRGGPAWLTEWGRPTKNGDKVAVIELTEEQIREAIDRKVDQKIAEHCDQRRQRPDTLPADVHNLAGLIAALLKQHGGLAIDRSRADIPTHLFSDRVVAYHRSGEKGKEVRTRILFHISTNANTTTAALRWLAQTTHKERVLLVTDARRPLLFGSQRDAKGKKFEKELSQRDPARFQHVKLTFDEYAHLDALQAVAGMARSGDLELTLPSGQSRRVNEPEVIESHRRQGRYQASPVLRELLTEEASRERTLTGNLA